MITQFDNRGHNFKWLVYFVDVLILTTVFVVFVNFVVEPMGWRNYDGDSRFYMDRFGHMFVFYLSYIVAVSAIKIRTKDVDSVIETFIRAIAQVAVMYLFFTFSVAILFHTFPGHLLLWSGIVNGVLICLSHCLITKIVIAHRKKNSVNLVFVGADYNNVRLYNEIKFGYSTYSYNILGFFSSIMADMVPEESNYLGVISDVVGYLEENDVDAVLCSLNPVRSEKEINAIIHLCERKFISFYFVPNMEGYPHRRMHFNKWGDVNIISLHNEPLLDIYKRGSKRLFDLVVSSVFLVTVFPVVLLVVSVGTKLSSPGPVFFKQKRTGYNGKPFVLYKFRSMRVNKDSDIMQATFDDPRKTRFGNFLRRSSIDELPQFINVLKGDMSIVGPRPHMEKHTEMYSKLIDEYLVRHLYRPGLTGWAQVNGCRGETKEVWQMEERVKKDIWYIENWSFMLDVRIILKTIQQVMKGDKKAY